MPDEPEPISPEHARQLLDNAIRETLGEEWDDPETGWVKVTGHDFMARLTRGRTNLDFYVDLLGSVRVEKTEARGMQESGRLLLLIFFGLSVVIAYLIVRIVSGG